MSFNTFGRVFRFSTWGESHGPALGALVDGCPPGLALSEADIQPFLDQRRPGTSRFTTQRQEPDAVRILSGVFEGRTTGTPISLMIENVDQRSKDYSDVAKAYRPGHADYSYDAKYGFRDYRGGGRSSARETAARVAAGAVARAVIPDVEIMAYVAEIGGDAINRDNFEASQIDKNPFFCPDEAAAGRWEKLVDEARKAGSSLGAVIECVATGVPPGWGAPLYAKLDSELAAKKMLTGCDPPAKGQTILNLWRITQAASRAAFRQGSPFWCVWRSSRPPPSSHRLKPLHVTATPLTSSPRAATILVWASGARPWSRR
jgi:chorismate synthase